MPAVIAGIVGGLAFQASRPGSDRLWVLVVLYGVAVWLAYLLGRRRRGAGAVAVAVASAEASAAASSSVVVNVDLGARVQGAVAFGGLDRAQWVVYEQLVDPVSLGYSDDPEIRAEQLGEELEPGDWLPRAAARRPEGRALALRPPDGAPAEPGF